MSAAVPLPLRSLAATQPRATLRRHLCLLAPLLSLSPAPALASQLFGPLASPAEPAVVVAKVPSADRALVALLEGRDALADATSLVGSATPRRARLLRGLAAGSGRVQDMVALLPLALSLASTLGDGRAAELAEDVMIASKNVVLMERILREKGGFDDADVPQESLRAGLAAADELIAAQLPALLAGARKQRCAQRLRAENDLEDMRDVANSDICLGVL